MNFDRRGFLKMFTGGVAGIALEQAIPLGRVWSFPSKIEIVRLPAFCIGDLVTIEGLNIFEGSDFEPSMPRVFLVSHVNESDLEVHPRPLIGENFEIGIVPKRMVRALELAPCAQAMPHPMIEL
jgi:hypothetical protein